MGQVKRVASFTTNSTDILLKIHVPGTMNKNRIQEGQAPVYLQASESEARAKTEQRVYRENAL